MITIRHSLPKDLDAIIEIFHYARQFMKEHGNPNQWINGYPSAELILREITNGTNYVCENENGEIIGTFCFIPGEDPTYARIDDGNWLNNGIMENFFGRLKVEMYYGEKFESPRGFIEKLEEYIHYYNNERISLKLKGMSPVQYRAHSQRT